MSRVGIFGIGAIGYLIVKYITKNQSNVYFFYSRKRKDSVIVKFEDELSQIPIETSDSLGQSLDWLIVCLKEYHFKNAHPMLRALAKGSTKVVIFQNGINISDRYSPFVDSDRLLETIIDCPIQMMNPQGYRQLKTQK